MAEQSILEFAKAVRRIPLGKAIRFRVELGVSVDGICSFEAKVRVCLLTILEQVDVIR